MSLFSPGMVQKVKNPRIRAFILHASTVTRREARRKYLDRPSVHAARAEAVAEEKVRINRAKQMAHFELARAALDASRSAKKAAKEPMPTDAAMVDEVERKREKLRANLAKARAASAANRAARKAAGEPAKPRKRKRKDA